MRLTEARQGVRMLKFMDVFGRWDAASLNQLEAAELLGVGERTFRRWCRRYEEEGEAGLQDRRIGKVSGRRVPVERCEEVEHLYRTRYQGFTARHFHEHLVRDHRFAWSYSWTRAFLQSRNLLAKAARRGAHRRKRPRRPLPGMMLHQDASRHAWLSDGPALDLVVTMDDATSEIYSAFLVEEEGTDSTFLALLAVFGRHGLPLSLYTDRGSHYFYTAEAGGKVARGEPTQVGRALAHLGVEHIAAYSPQARGRSERLFQTLQDRVPKELVLAGITTMAEANAWLRDTYIPAHNARFATKAEQEGSAFVVGRTRRRQRQLRLIPQSQATDTGEPVASALREGERESASLPRRQPRCFPWPPLPRPLRQQRRCNRRTSCGGPREKGRRPVPPSGSRRAQGCQGRFAPRRGDLACGEAIPDSPSARRTLTCQVGSGKWS
jgi:Integrase core domain.